MLESKVTAAKVTVNDLNVIYSEDIPLIAKSENDVSIKLNIDNSDLSFNIKLKVIKTDELPERKIQVNKEITRIDDTVGFNIYYKSEKHTNALIKKPVQIFTLEKKDTNEPQEDIYINFILESLSGENMVLRVYILSKVYNDG